MKKTNLKQNKELILGMLLKHYHCISYNEKQDIPVWNYMLNEDKTNLFIFDENDNTIYDGLIINAPDMIFDYGEIFEAVNLNGNYIPENIITRENIWVLHNKQNDRKRGNERCTLK